MQCFIYKSFFYTYLGTFVHYNDTVRAVIYFSKMLLGTIRRTARLFIKYRATGLYLSEDKCPAVF